MVQHKLSKKSKNVSIPAGNKQSMKKKKTGTKKSTANRGDSFKFSKTRRKAESQKVDAAITKMINKKNEECFRARAAVDMRAGKS